MAKKIVVIRSGKREDLGTKYQTWEVPAVLAPAGVEMARQFACNNRDLLAKCQVFACSLLPRAQQTLHTIMMELGKGLEAMDRIVLSQDLWTIDPTGYVVPGKMLTMRELAAELPAFAHKEGDRIFDCGIAGDVLCEMGVEDEVALAVTHGGPIDFLLAQAKFTLGNENAYQAIEDLGGCQGMILTFDEDNYLANVEELRWTPAPVEATKCK